MERLTLNRRQKTTGDRIDCIPAGDGLPVWTTISLDAKLPMMQNPKGSVIMYTTKLGEPKHRCKQEYDFDLRDPNGQYITNEYQPLHDPHLRFHFNTQLMRRHLIKKGFISEDGKVLCSLKEFNQYRQYLRHTHFLEIAKERKEELEAQLSQSSNHRRDVEILEKQVSHGSLVRRRFQQQRERDLLKLKRNINEKANKLENRLREIRDEMTRRERKQRQEAEKRQMAVYKNQQESEMRNLMLLKRWKNRDRMRTRLLEDRVTQRKIQAELKCMEKWSARKNAQTMMLEKNQDILKNEEHERLKSIHIREQMMNKKRETIEKKIEKLKLETREQKQKRDERYFKRLDEKLASGDYRIWTKRKERKRVPNKTFLSTWKLQDVLNSLEIPDMRTKPGDQAYMMALNQAIDSAVDMVTDQSNDAQYEVQAKDIVDDVIAKVKNDLYPKYLLMLDGENDGENDAIKSKSVRFNEDETEISGDLPPSCTDTLNLKPVAEHILTPVASQLEIAKLEAEAIIGSPDIADKTSSVTFVETLLLRLLNDLNSGKLSKEEIMKLASYSMDIIQSAEGDKQDDTIVEVPEESETEGVYLAASSSSVIAKKMVDFTLSKILSDVQTGGVHPDDIASLTVSLMDNIAGCESGETVSDSDSALDNYIDSTLERATTSAIDPREDSPVCDALLDDFMVSTLKRLINDLENEVLTKAQVQQLAASFTDETKTLLPQHVCDIEKPEEIQHVLHDLHEKLQSGEIDIQRMYQVMFAIVYAYNSMSTTKEEGTEAHLTEMLMNLLLSVEQKAANGELLNVNVNIVHEAANRLSNTNLDSNQIEKLSKSFASNTDIAGEHSETEIAAAELVTQVILKAKLQLENANDYPALNQGMENMAEAIINVIPDECESPTFTDVFVNLLQELKQAVQNIDGPDDLMTQSIGDLINKIASNELSQETLLEIASSIARVMRSPVKSESSIAAALAVKDSLKEVLNDIKGGTLENSFLQEMVKSLQTCLSAAESKGQKTSSFVTTLSSFLKNVVDQLTLKVQTGEMTEDDIAELSKSIQNRLNSEENIAEKEVMTENADNTAEETQKQNALGFTDILHFIQNLIDNTNETELTTEETRDLGLKFIDCGKKLVKPQSGAPSVANTPCTNTVADNVIEEVIKTLQTEIDNGVLSTETLKEVTKVIINSSGTSEAAGEVNNTAGKQTHAGKDALAPTLTKSPSASTVASHIVMKTICSICQGISSKGIPPAMISSLASTIITDLSGENPLTKALPDEFQRFKPTLINIVKCLKEDKVSESCAESMFCLILEKYKTCVLEIQDEAQIPETLSGEDVSLVNALVIETLDNVRRSVTKGRMDNSEFSIPSMPHSEDTSVIANGAIDNNYLDDIRKSVAAEKAMPKEPKEDISFINDIVVGTLDNVRRSVNKGRIEEKAFSIPSLPHSDDSSVIAINLIDACLDSIQKDISAEKAMPSEPKHDLIDFILEIVARLQEELEEGTISNLSMAHFYKAISHDNDDMKTLEANALENLKEVVNNIRQYREQSEYVHCILETYLLPDRAADEVFGDPLKAIENILVSVSSEILTKFVKATLQTILMDVRSDSTPITDKTPSAFVLRSASSIIAENVIQEVVSRIRHDMSQSIDRIHGTVSKQEIERAASRLINTTSNIAARSSRNADVSKSMSTTSKEVEDMVLETLHNIVSNVRFEQSMKSQKGSKHSQQQASGSNSEIEDFVLDSLQTLIVDQQDRRSQIDMGVEKTWSKYDGSSLELRTGESKDAMGYVNEVLKNVLREMKEEIAMKEETMSTEKAADLESYSVQTMILECLQRALFDTLAPDSLNAAVELYHQEDIRKILLESVLATITNIRDGKFSQHDIDTMFRACKRFFEEVDPEYVVKDADHATPQHIIELMDQVKNKVESLTIDNSTLANISTQLATLGMESQQPDKTTSGHTVSDLSSSSSYVNELVQDVITRMSAQLSDNDKPAVENHDVEKQPSEAAKSESSGKVSSSKSSTSKGSSIKKDVNYNRRVSVTTMSSRTSLESIASSNGTLTEEIDRNKQLPSNNQVEKRQPISSTNIKQTDQRSPPPVAEKKLTRRSRESRPVIRRSPMPAKPNSDHMKTNSIADRPIMTTPYVHRIPQQKQSPMKRNITVKISPKVSRDSPLNTREKIGQNSKKPTDKHTTMHGHLGRSPIPQKPRLVNKVTKQRPKSISKETENKKNKRRTTPEVVVDNPLELRSLCGSHRTKLSYKVVPESPQANDAQQEAL